MIVNKQQLIRKAPIKGMLTESKKVFGRSYGLSHAGYDIRLKQAIHFKVNQDNQQPIISVIDGNMVERTSGRFTLASAIEYFQMPNDLVGIVHDKSTNARLGIQVFNTVIEPAWEGYLTLELVFNGNEEIYLEAGTPIAQVIFHTLTETSQYEGKYQGQDDKPIEAILEK